MTRRSVRYMTRTALLLALLAPLLALMGPSPALAATTECGGGPGEIETIGTDTIQGNLVVRDNDGCSLEGTTVTGNVKVGAGAALLTDGATIDGSVRSAGVYVVGLDNGTRVGGNVVLSGGTGGIYLIDAHIGGKVMLTANSQSVLGVAESEIGGALTIVSNFENSRMFVFDTIVGGNVRYDGNSGNTQQLIDNTIRGSLRCSDNDPPPTVDGNTVSGRTSGECAEA